MATNELMSMNEFQKDSKPYFSLLVAQRMLTVINAGSPSMRYTRRTRGYRTVAMCYVGGWIYVICRSRWEMKSTLDAGTL